MTIRERKLIDNREYLRVYENVKPETVSIKHNELTFQTDGDFTATHRIKIKMTVMIDVLD